MLFNSHEFAVYIVIFFAAYLVVLDRLRIYLLLVASYSFYAYWSVPFTALMLYVSMVNYFYGIFHERFGSKRALLLVVIVLSLIPLIYYKYSVFFSEICQEILGLEVPGLLTNDSLIMPVGISFFTFQGLSYSFDIYRGTSRVERNVVYFLTYIAYFPQLIAGPIERPSNILKQFRKKYKFSVKEFNYGVYLFVQGLFKKVVVADRLAMYVDPVFAHNDFYNGETILLAVVFFSFQIYADFSGYSDMARGLSKILGINLMENFKVPYGALSISQFWRRWHISLSSWFSDYVYFPLGGNRVPFIYWVRNIFVVFVLSAVWHGANWTFIVWGLLHGAYYLVEKILAIVPYKFNFTLIPALIRKLVVFVLVSFTWIYFRADSVQIANQIVKRIAGTASWDVWMGFSFSSTLIGFVSIFILMFLDRKYLSFSEGKLSKSAQDMVVLFLIVFISIFGVSSSQFIYFQF